MASVNTYLNFDGNCAAAFDFYKSVFGGEFRSRVLFEDMPGPEGVSPQLKGKIMHVALPIGAHTILMGSDWAEHVGGKMVRGNAASIAIGAESKAEADRLFNGLSAGGTVTMPMMDAPWNSYFGMFTDKFGIQWMVDCPKSQG